MKNVMIYTDGACSGNPGPGGWGAILFYQEHRRELSGSAKQTTNNRMEITAALEALKVLKEPCSVQLYTDSAYLCNAFQNGWINHWVQNGWKTSQKKPVENQDLWMELLEQCQIHTIKWNKVKGHADNPHNNRCDELARKAINKCRLQ